MKVRIKYMIFLIAAMGVILTTGVYSHASSVSEFCDEPERFVLDLINQYRTAPYFHAVSLGYDPMVLAEKGINPETWLAPYEMDEILCAAATDANAEAAALPDDSRVPVKPERQRTVQTGSVLTFSNFIPVETAGTFFVQNLLKNELNSGDFQFILSNAYKYAGVSLTPGVLDGRNAWFSSLVLGSAARVIDIQLLNLINQVRAEPQLVPLCVSTDFLDLFRQNERIYQLPGMRFQPVFFNELLYEFAEADVLKPDAPESGMEADAQWNMETAVEQAIHEPENTYPGGYFDNVTASVSWTDLSNARYVTDLFSALLVNEFSTWPYQAIIFSNHYNEAGAFISVDAGEPQVNPEPWKPSLHPGIGTVSFFSGPGMQLPNADPLPEAETPSARIYGLVFIDYNGDYIYAPGHEAPRETVSVYDIHRNLVTSVVTDNAGYFSVTLQPGQYWFEAWHAGQFVQQFVQVEDDQFLKMGFNVIPSDDFP